MSAGAIVLDPAVLKLRYMAAVVRLRDEQPKFAKVLALPDEPEAADAAALAHIVDTIELRLGAKPEVPAEMPAATPTTVVEPAAPPSVVQASTMPRKKNQPKLNRAQVLGRAKRRQEQDEATGAKYHDGGYGRIPNAVLKLIGSMPLPCLRAYVVGCILARNDNGTFRVSRYGMARLIGSEGGEKRRHNHEERVVRRLADAGLWQQESRGGRKKGDKSNEYRLLSLAKLNLDRVREILSQPLTKSGSAYAKGIVTPQSETAR